jgi:hypothetical protein
MQSFISCRNELRSREAHLDLTHCSGAPSITDALRGHRDEFRFGLVSNVSGRSRRTIQLHKINIALCD